MGFLVEIVDMLERRSDVDTGRIGLEHAYFSLVLMTTLIQGAIGSLCFALVFRALQPQLLLTLLAITALALSSSVFHLGRPAYAWRALKMWRRSWLSREVHLFGLFFAALICLTAGACAAALPPSWLLHLHGSTIAPFQHAAFSALAMMAFGILTAIVGVAGIIASAFIYLVPARPSWNMLHTTIDFLLSAALIGTILPALLGARAHAFVSGGLTFEVCLVTALLWIANQCLRWIRLHRSNIFEHRASAALLNHPGQRTALIASLLLAAAAPLLARTGSPAFACVATFGAVLLSRSLFFVTVVPLNMALTFTRGGAH